MYHVTSLIRTTQYVRSPGNVSRGFTLIELIVVIAIMATISAIALLGNASFNHSILLSENTHNLATVMHNAQALGLSNQNVAGSSYENVGYGFNVTTAGTDTYTIFADLTPPPTQLGGCFSTDPTLPDALPGDCRYNPGSDVLIRQYHLDRGFTIRRFCAASGATTYCSDSPSFALASLDITFMPTRSGAVITGTDGSSGGFSIWHGSTATLYVQAPGGETRCVTVRDTGQILLPQTCP